jgi:hypothetical protein
VGTRRKHGAEVHGTFLLLTSTFGDDTKGFQNITAFLMTQNQQFDDAMGGLNYAKESLDPARFDGPLSATLLRSQGL